MHSMGGTVMPADRSMHGATGAGATGTKPMSMPAAPHKIGSSPSAATKSMNGKEMPAKGAGRPG